MASKINHSEIISVIPSYQDKTKYLRITDYYYDEKLNHTIINGIFKNKEYVLPIKNEPLDQKEFPNTIGLRYFKIQAYIFFLDYASDNAGAF